MQTTINHPKIALGRKRIDIFPYWVGLLLLGLVFGLVGAVTVLVNGLHVTGLTNKVPWGLWVTIDLASIALGGSAFTFGVIVFLLRLKRFEIMAKLAVMIGFIGYTTATVVIWFDLGQPIRFWHPMVYWQPHSLLWEITMCVILYTMVLIAEIAPVLTEHSFFYEHPLLEKYPLLKRGTVLARKASAWLHKGTPVLAVVGLTLSLLHQASLGAYYSVLFGRGMWFNTSAPVQFVFSAMSGGVAFLFFLGVIVFRVMRPGLVKDDVLYDVARIAGGITLLLTYLRLWDWAVTNYYSFDRNITLQTEALNAIAPYSASFWFGQILLPIIAGAILLSAKSVKSFRYLMAAAVIPVVSTVLTRWTYNFSGLIATPTYDPYTPIIRISSYTPTWPEFAVASLVLSYWLLMFTLAARFLPFHNAHEDH